VVTLSEGGFAIETMREFETGETIRLCILPHRRERAVKVTGIVWNDRQARRTGSLRVFGCVVSDPPPRFLELLAEVEQRESSGGSSRSPARARAASPTERARRPVLERKLRRRVDREVARSPERRPPVPPLREAELPRSREPMPPPKPEPEETLPRFRVRLKQVGGTRTRTVALKAPSSARAAQRAVAELSRDGMRWQVLEVERAKAPARKRR
jgi:hypothetical protein